MKASKFYYRKGHCETKIPWFKPDPHYMNKWKEEFFKIPNVEKFRYFMHGGTAYGSSETWDIDIAVCGDSSELEIIEDILRKGTQLGLDNRQLIDMHHIQIPADIYSYPTACNHFESACHTFRETGTCTFEECYETKPSRKWPQIIYYGVERTKNDESMKLRAEGSSYIKGELYISPESGLADTEKVANKMRSRVYTSAPIEINQSTDFRRHIIWPE